MYRLQKLAFGLANLLLIGLFVLALTGKIDWRLSCVSVTVSGIWLALTFLRLNQLLETFEDHISRVQILLPMGLSLLLAVAVLFTAPSLTLAAIAGLIILGWAPVYLLYHKRDRDFIRQGHGPLPKDVWVNPPAEALQEGDLILTGGRMAARTHNSVGHVEIVVRGRDGKLMAFSSYMETGVVMHTARAMVKVELRSREHYIVLRLRQPFTAEQSSRAIEIAQEMLAANDAWRKEWTENRLRIARRLPLPTAFKAWLLNEHSMDEVLKNPPLSFVNRMKLNVYRQVWATGYDWLGQYTGLIHDNRWTCMGVVIELLRRLDVPVRHYGTGLLGLGTGLLNPLMPIRLMRDPCYRLVTVDDKQAFESASKT